MPRKPRLHVPGGLYHVILRGNNRQTLFFTAADHRRLNQLVARAIDRLQARVHAFCWMPNHIHLAVQVGQEPLGRLMQWIASRYAYYLNRRRQHTGHVFERRYRAILVDAEAYLLELVRYIHRNPVKARLVNDPAAYPWSSHRHYVGRGRLDWLTTEWVLSLFAAQPARARRLFARFVLNPDAVEPPDELLVGSDEDPRLAGDKDWLEQLYETDYQPPSSLSLDDLIAEVFDRHGVSPAALAGPSRQRQFARIRAEVAHHAITMGVASLTDIARRFNRSPATVLKTLRRYQPPE